MLELEIQRRRKRQPILLMTHIVLGYPSLAASRRIVESMVEAGVDLIELQIPFSEPIADGPVILHANQRALRAGTTVQACFELAARLADELPIPFVFMCYYNTIWTRGTERFASETRAAGLHGAIVPDLPYEEASDLLAAFRRHELDPIFIYSPETRTTRMRAIAERARGFVYCVARKGVTGSKTEFGEVREYLARCRSATTLPLALGFGVQRREDIATIEGHADIAVVGSETIRIIEERGVEAIPEFIRSLR